MARDLQAKPGEDVLISVQLGTTDLGLFPQAKIYNINDLTTVVATVNLDEIETGAYAKKWTTPETELKYWVRITVYTDSYGGTASPIDRPTEQGILVQDSGGGNGYLFGGGNQKDKVGDCKLTEEDKKDIADMVTENIAADLVSIKEDHEASIKLISLVSDNVNTIKTNDNNSKLDIILNKIKDIDFDKTNKLITDIKFNTDLSETMSSIGNINSNIITLETLVKDSAEEIKQTITIPEIKLTFPETKTKSQKDDDVNVKADPDLKLAMELINDPRKIKNHRNLSQKVLNYILWIKDSR